MNLDIIKNMTNLEDSGQDQYIENYAILAKNILHEQGVSNKYLNTDDASFILSKVIIDLIDNNELSNTTNALIATLRVNHSHDEDLENV